jgi:SnoaL-like protein
MTPLDHAAVPPDLARRLAALLDRAEIAELIDRFVTALDTAEQDDRDDEWYRGIFTDDVRLSFPIGERRGVDGLAEFEKRAKLAWEATLHVSGNHTAEVSGDRARARAHIVGTHVAKGTPPFGVDPEHRFDMGGYYDIDAVRTDRGWRISALRYVLVWTSGGGKPDSGGPGRWAGPADA